MFSYVLLFPLLLFVNIRTANLSRNYLAARRFGLPIIVLPVSFGDAWWLPLRPLFSWVERLPFGFGRWYVYTEMGWPTVDGIVTVRELGETFVLVTPTSNQIISCYPPTIERVFKDVRRFHMPASQSRLFAFFGQNVSSTEGADWQRHRKITAAAFNEKSMHYVWTEAVKYTRQLDFKDPVRTLGGIRSTFNVLAMKVLAAAGFNEDTDLSVAPAGHHLTLMESLGFIMENLILTVVFNGLKAPTFLLPTRLKELKLAVDELRLYMQESVLRQIQSPSQRSAGRPTTLLEAMVNANEVEKQQVHKTSGKPSHLTESELYGNIFVFNLAGYETTASSMSFALPYLAAFPNIQDWIIEEIDTYYSKAGGDLPYDKLYPKLVRIQALLYETLRLASPAPLLVRTPSVPTEIPISTSQGEKTLTVNPGTLVGVHFYGAHLSSRWGADARVFNPKRFIGSSGKGETLAIPDGPLYIPWMFGPRNCPGKKFSQVEFVAVLAQLLTEYRVEVLVRDGESSDEARVRLLAVMEEKYFNISAYVKRPEDAGIRLQRRHPESM